jgi:membrane protein implicated in regulation of membrane protease activity
MKYVKIYLMASSVVLHIVLIVFLFWAAPFYSNASKAANELAQNMQSSGEKGIVTDVSEIIRGEYRYKGYLIKYNGQDLFVSGTGRDTIEKGDQVNVLIQEHPYAPTKSLMVIVTKSLMK